MNPIPRYIAAIMLMFTMGGLTGASQAVAAPAPDYLIDGISLEQKDDAMLLRISGDTAPTFTSYQLFAPPRVIIDIADAELADGVSLPGPTDVVEEIRGATPEDRQNIVRVEVVLTTPLQYRTAADNNDILLTLATPPREYRAGKTRPGDPAKQPPPADEPVEDHAAILEDLQKRSSPLELGEPVVPRIPPLEVHTGPRQTIELEPSTDDADILSDPEPEPEEEVEDTLVDPFGIDDHQINVNVEFFKTDLHNVFRFFGEATQRNVVVDEAVSGDLTLTLKDVPWDFALEIILNLKDLQMEERHNTMVISPGDREFEWPERPADRLQVRADQGPQIEVRQRLEHQPERVQARELIKQASEQDARGNLAAALNLYEKALNLWPDNVRLAERVATIYLAHMGNNSRAHHFARLALRHEGNNDRIALIAAIASANMQRSAEAKEYFDLSISRPQPAAEALVSYAAFAEEHDSPNGALALLKRHNKLFGDSLETMIAKARLFERIDDSQQAMEQYRAILLSGYDLPQDLEEYIQHRIDATGE